MSKEAMKLALESLIAAIETAKTDVTHYAAIDFDICADAIQKGNAALEALAKQEQGEPVVWKADDNFDGMHVPEQCDLTGGETDCTTPQQRKPLTDEQILKLDVPCFEDLMSKEIIDFARAIEAAHGIKADQC